MKHIFVIDDDANIRQLILRYLEKEGYKVTTFENADSVLEAFNVMQPEALVLDIMMPGTMDGLDLCKKIRTVSQVPIIFVSAKDEAVDRIIGLELGADDYLSKPFHLVELNARIKSVIRRHQNKGEINICQGNVRIEPDKFRVFVENQELELNRKEYDILLYFMNRPGRLINKNTLAESVWGDHIDQVDNFDFIYAQIKNLRKKLKDSGANIELKAVYGFGYKMIVE